MKKKLFYTLILFFLGTQNAFSASVPTLGIIAPASVTAHQQVAVAIVLQNALVPINTATVSVR
ncbi:MAG TPA: hypothetical protein VLB02_01620, partial [Candidatus Paceibacterota bacterium]|nr:hypothetical protein [Candidatus Paceibacterota bacterium]